MDFIEKAKIRTHLHNLINYTVCDSRLLNIFQERGMLTPEGVDLIKREDTDLDKAGTFFRLIQANKNNSYRALVLGLKEAGQEDVAKVLDTGVTPLRLEMKWRIRKILGPWWANAARTTALNKQLLTLNWRDAAREIRKTDHGIVTLHILYIMAYLSPYNITVEMLRHLSSVINMDNLLAEALSLLMKYGLLPSARADGSLQTYPLLQEVTRSELMRRGKEAPIIKDVLEMLLARFEEGGLLPSNTLGHVLVAWEHTWRYPTLAACFSGVIPIAVLQLRVEGNDLKAVKFGEAAVEKLGPVFYEGDNPIILVTMREVAKALLSRRRFHQAFTKISWVIERHTLMYGDIHPETLSSILTLGSIYAGDEKPQEALELFQKVYGQQAIQLSEMDPALLQTRLMIAGLYGDLGRLEEALEIYEDTYQKFKLTATPIKHLLQSASLAYGKCLNSLGQFERALAVLQEIFEDVQELSGGERIAMNEIASAIGDVYWNMGEHEKALEKHEQVHQEFKTIFGARHPNTLKCVRNLAVNLSKMGRHEEALQVFQGAQPLLEETFVEDSHELLRWQAVHALILAREGTDLTKASQILGEVKAKLVEAGLGNSPNVRNDLQRYVEWTEEEISANGRVAT